MLQAVMPLVFALGAGFAALSAPIAAEELKLAHFMSPRHVYHTGVMTPWAEEIARATCSGRRVISSNGRRTTI